ncbi:43178_t:CDS:2, partial [Gigaspora margarita]
SGRIQASRPTKIPVMKKKSRIARPSEVLRHTEFDNSTSPMKQWTTRPREVPRFELDQDQQDQPNTREEHELPGKDRDNKTLPQTKEELDKDRPEETRPTHTCE